MKQYLKWTAKLLATALLLYWVFIQTDRKSLMEAIGGSEKKMFLAAFLPYLVSRIYGSYRLTNILNYINVPLSRRSGLFLNWISMFYGIFLPGGLGGDAYKLIALKRRFPDRDALLLTRALLWDRLVGFVVLVALTILLLTFYIPGQYRLLAVLPMLAIGVALWLATRQWLPQILPKLGGLVLLSLIVQLAQVVSICLLMYAIGVDFDFEKYNLLFLISSVASMLPFSIGGVGVRELVFLKGAPFLHISTQSSVAVSVLFDVIVTLTALTGSIATLIKQDSVFSQSLKTQPDEA